MRAKFQIAGYVGNVELRSTSSGKEVANISVACSSRVKKGDNWEDVTEWHRVTAFGSTASFINRNATKGSGISISGILQPYQYDKDGVTVHGYNFILEEFQLFKKPGSDTSARNKEERPPEGFKEEDIPF